MFYWFFTKHEKILFTGFAFVAFFCGLLLIPNQKTGFIVTLLLGVSLLVTFKLAPRLRMYSRERLFLAYLGVIEMGAIFGTFCRIWTP